MRFKGLRQVSYSASSRTCRIYIAKGLAFSEELWPGLLKGSRKVCLVADSAVYRSLGRRLERVLRRPLAVTLSRGERAKRWREVERLQSRMIEAGFGRDSTLVALGGGTVTDAAGLAAATFMRGIRWVSVPTTLVGQVDSGIGGKTAVNLPGGRNAAGAFHQPEAVVCDADLLAGLDKRAIVSGLCEMVKYALLFSPGFLDSIRHHWRELLLLDESVLIPSIAHCAQWKAEIVSQDEREERGIRQLLNMGHTAGHALETLTGYKRFTHGEAVLWGMRLAVRLSMAKRILSPGVAEDIDSFLLQIPVPDLPHGLGAAALWSAMRSDKKRVAGTPVFVLLQDVGKPVLDATVEKDEFEAAWRGLL